MVGEHKTAKNEARQELSSGNLSEVKLPTGGGAIRGIGESLEVNAATGTASMSIPLALPTARGDLAPSLSLVYSSGIGNSICGTGWSLQLQSIIRKTSKGLPVYDRGTKDTFLFGGETLVPDSDTEPVECPIYVRERFRPRVETHQHKIERWTHRESGEEHWRVVSANNVVSIYGRSAESRIGIEDGCCRRIFEWLLEHQIDDRGNAISYHYKSEDLAGVRPETHELHRLNGRSTVYKKHLKEVRYGNRKPVKQEQTPPESPEDWFFRIILDYGEHDPANPLPDPDEQCHWPCRPDPFSDYRAGFEQRTYRLCRRVLVFHQFKELRDGAPTLTRSTDLFYDKVTPVPYAEAGAEQANSHWLGNDKILTKLTGVIQVGYQPDDAGGYLCKSYPPVEFAYDVVEGQPRPAPSGVKVASEEGLLNIPSAIDGSEYRFLDLHGEGLPGILANQNGRYY